MMILRRIRLQHSNYRFVLVIRWVLGLSQSTGYSKEPKLCSIACAGKSEIAGEVSTIKIKRLLS